MGEMPWRTLTLFQCRHKRGSHGHFGDRKDAGRHFGGLAGVSRGLAQKRLAIARKPHAPSPISCCTAQCGGGCGGGGESEMP